MSTLSGEGFPPAVADAFRRVEDAQRAGLRKVDGPENARRLELDGPPVVYFPDAGPGVDPRTAVVLATGVLSFVALLFAAMFVNDAIEYAVGPGVVGVVLLLVSFVTFVRAGEQVERFGAYLLGDALVIRTKHGVQAYDRARIGGLGTSKSDVHFSYPDAGGQQVWIPFHIGRNEGFKKLVQAWHEGRYVPLSEKARRAPNRSWGCGLAGALCVLAVPAGFALWSGAGLSGLSQDYLTDIREGRLHEAYAMLTTARRQQESFEAWEQGLDPALRSHTNTSFNKTATMSDADRSWGCVQGGILLPEGSRIVYLVLVEEADGWRVDRVSFTRPPECPMLM